MVKIGGRFSYTKRNAKEPFDLEAVHRQISGATPFIAPYTADGRFGSVQALDENGLMLYSLYNPLIHLANGASTTDSDYLSLDAHATINFMKDLNLQVVWASMVVGKKRIDIMRLFMDIRIQALKCKQRLITRTVL